MVIVALLGKIIQEARGRIWGLQMCPCTLFTLSESRHGTLQASACVKYGVGQPGKLIWALVSGILYTDTMNWLMAMSLKSVPCPSGTTRPKVFTQAHVTGFSGVPNPSSLWCGQAPSPTAHLLSSVTEHTPPRSWKPDPTNLRLNSRTNSWPKQVSYPLDLVIQVRAA